VAGEVPHEFEKSIRCKHTPDLADSTRMRKSSIAVNGANRGFILVAVLWLAGLIAALATGFMLKVRIEALTAANVNQNAQEIR
jgi:hypothetical protein